MEVAQARLETGEIQADLLRSFLVLADYGEGIWEDRFWATGDRSLSELRSRRRVHEARLGEVLLQSRLSSFGVDAEQRLYVTDLLMGRVFRFAPGAAPTPVP